MNNPTVSPVSPLLSVAQPPPEEDFLSKVLKAYVAVNQLAAPPRPRPSMITSLFGTEPGAGTGENVINVLSSLTGRSSQPNVLSSLMNLAGNVSRGVLASGGTHIPTSPVMHPAQTRRSLAGFAPETGLPFSLKDIADIVREGERLSNERVKRDLAKESTDIERMLLSMQHESRLMDIKEKGLAEQEKLLEAKRALAKEEERLRELASKGQITPLDYLNASIRLTEIATGLNTMLEHRQKLLKLSEAYRRAAEAPSDVIFGETTSGLKYKAHIH